MEHPIYQCPEYQADISGKAKIANKYLQQFQQLIPPKVALLKQALAQQDRQTVRQVLHNICPQLQFFGIPGVVPPIRQITSDFQSMDWDELQGMAAEIMEKLEEALEEVADVLATKF